MHKSGRNSSVLKILTSKFFAMKILRTFFVRPVPSKPFHRGGGRGVPRPKRKSTSYPVPQSGSRSELFRAEIHSRSDRTQIARQADSCRADAPVRFQP